MCHNTVIHAAIVVYLTFVLFNRLIGFIYIAWVQVRTDVCSQNIVPKLFGLANYSMHLADGIVNGGTRFGLRLHIFITRNLQV